MYYCVHDVKGRHDLIMRGLTKLVMRLLQSSFQTLMCYLCLCSQRYIVVHIELVNFLRLWQQLKQRC